MVREFIAALEARGYMSGKPMVREWFDKEAKGD